MPNARKATQLKHRARWFDEADIARCMVHDFPDLDESLRIRNRAIVRLLIETGARVKEIARIKAENIDFDTNTVMIDDSKTEPRPVFFSDYTAGYLKSIRQQSGNIFGTEWSGRISPNEDTIKKIIVKMLEDLGLKNGKDGQGPHTFRHYTATFLHYERGLSIMDIAWLLGDTVETIQNNYIHPTPSMLRRRVAAAWGLNSVGLLKKNLTCVPLLLFVMH